MSISTDRRVTSLRHDGARVSPVLENHSQESGVGITQGPRGGGLRARGRGGRSRGGPRRGGPGGWVWQRGGGPGGGGEPPGGGRGGPSPPPPTGGGPCPPPARVRPPRRAGTAIHAGSSP